MLVKIQHSLPPNHATIPALLIRLDGVRQTSPARWRARCPAHDDRNPSLSVREGVRGILLKCWSGCTFSQIAAALGIEPQSLFHDAINRNPHIRREIVRTREADAILRDIRRQAEWELVGLRQEAEVLIEAARGIDVSTWPDEKLDAALDVLADAHLVLEAERREEAA